MSYKSKCVLRHIEHMTGQIVSIYVWAMATCPTHDAIMQRLNTEVYTPEYKGLPNWAKERIRGYDLALCLSALYINTKGNHLVYQLTLDGIPIGEEWHELPTEDKKRLSGRHVWSANGNPF